MAATPSETNSTSRRQMRGRTPILGVFPPPVRPGLREKEVREDKSKTPARG